MKIPVINRFWLETILEDPDDDRPITLAHFKKHNDYYIYGDRVKGTYDVVVVHYDDFSYILFKNTDIDFYDPSKKLIEEFWLDIFFKLEFYGAASVLDYLLKDYKLGSDIS